jgi:hypothetical protein
VPAADPVAALLAAVAPLLDREVMHPYPSAWEFNGWEGPGEDLHAALTVAYEAVLAHQAHQAVEHTTRQGITYTVCPCGLLILDASHHHCPGCHHPIAADLATADAS